MPLCFLLLSSISPVVPYMRCKRALTASSRHETSLAKRVLTPVKTVHHADSRIQDFFSPRAINSPKQILKSSMEALAWNRIPDSTTAVRPNNLANRLSRSSVPFMAFDVWDPRTMSEIICLGDIVSIVASNYA